MSRLLITVFALLVLASLAIGADVQLKSVANAKPGLPLRLSDVADITGKGADAIADLVIIDDPTAELGTRRWLTVGPDDIRKAMRANDISTSRHTINGRACHIRVRTEAVQRPKRDTEAKDAEIVDLEGPQTVRTRIARTLAQRYGVNNADMRILFDEGNEPLLSRRLAGLTAVVRPISSAVSDRLRVEVRLVQGERVVGSGTVTGIVQVRRTVALLRTRLDKGVTITRADLRPDTRWLEPAVASDSVGVEKAIGQRTTNRLDPNQIVRTSDLEAPLAVRRNDTVIVLTVVGGISIETKARVLRDGAVGERVQCRLHRSSEPFEAVVTAPGRVLVNLDYSVSGTRPAKAAEQGDLG